LRYYIPVKIGFNLSLFCVSFKTNWSLNDDCKIVAGTCLIVMKLCDQFESDVNGLPSCDSPSCLNVLSLNVSV